MHVKFKGGVTDKALECGGTPAGYGIPDLDGLVARARGQPAAIGRPCDGIDRVSMALERSYTPAAYGIPDLDGVVVRARGQPPAIGRPCDRLDRVAVALEGD